MKLKICWARPIVASVMTLPESRPVLRRMAKIVASEVENCSVSSKVTPQDECLEAASIRELLKRSQNLKNEAQRLWDLSQKLDAKIAEALGEIPAGRSTVDVGDN